MELTLVNTAKYCNNRDQLIEVTTTRIGNKLNIHTDRFLGTATIQTDCYEYDGVRFTNSMEMMEYILDDGSVTVCM